MGRSARGRRRSGSAAPVAIGRPARPLAAAGSFRGALWGVLIRAAALVAVLLVAGCGGPAAGGEGDPATRGPGRRAVLRRGGRPPRGRAARRRARCRRQGAGDRRSEARIRRARGAGLIAAQGEEIDYERDIAPWLGERAAVWTRARGRTYEPVVVLLAATDTDRRASRSRRCWREAGTRSPSARTATATTSWTRSGGPPASSTTSWRSGGKPATSGRSTPPRATRSPRPTDTRTPSTAPGRAARPVLGRHVEAAGHGRARGSAAGPAALARSGGELPQIAGAFMANGDRLGELEMQAGEMLPAQSTPLLQELPGDSWAAFGAGDVGTTLRDAIDRFGGALGGVAIRGQLRERARPRPRPRPARLDRPHRASSCAARRRGRSTAAS